MAQNIAPEAKDEARELDGRIVGIVKALIEYRLAHPPEAYAAPSINTEWFRSALMERASTIMASLATATSEGPAAVAIHHMYTAMTCWRDAGYDGPTLEMIHKGIEIIREEIPPPIHVQPQRPPQLDAVINQRIGKIQYLLSQTPTEEHDGIIHREVQSALAQSGAEYSPSPELIEEVTRTILERIAAAKQNPDLTEFGMDRFRNALDEKKGQIELNIAVNAARQGSNIKDTYAHWAMSNLRDMGLSGATFYQILLAIEAIKEEFPPPKKRQPA
ncbi:MAG: hypothetical protein LBJ69_02130 [Holosporales bacterium]|jgi:hypothetical protein|nr:hypothetical protein [Holosporales bacterium]